MSTSSIGEGSVYKTVIPQEGSHSHIFLTHGMTIFQVDKPLLPLQSNVVEPYSTVVTQLSCSCHAVVMQLSCNCQLSCSCHAIVTQLSCNCHILSYFSFAFRLDHFMSQFIFFVQHCSILLTFNALLADLECFSEIEGIECQTICDCLNVVNSKLPSMCKHSLFNCLMNFPANSFNSL